ncbi:MAG: NEW3 domain-containing protein, partial [Methanobacteriota archaeon]
MSGDELRVMSDAPAGRQQARLPPHHPSPITVVLALAFALAFALALAFIAPLAASQQGPFFGVSVELSEGEAESKLADPGQAVEFRFTVTNTGSVARPVDLSLSESPAGWTGSVEPTSMQLGAGESAEAVVSV